MKIPENLLNESTRFIVYFEHSFSTLNMILYLLMVFLSEWVRGYGKSALKTFIFFRLQTNNKNVSEIIVETMSYSIIYF